MLFLWCKEDYSGARQAQGTLIYACLGQADVHTCIPSVPVNVLNSLG
jgi:hypothetical protein